MSRRRRYKPKSTPPAARKSEGMPHRQQEKAYETSDMPSRRIAYLAALLFGGLILSGALVAGIVTLIARERPPTSATAMERQALTPPEPRLEIAPSADRAKLDVEAERRLQRYEWIDKAAGRARIPIDEAMRITARLGWQDPTEKSRP